MSPARDVPHFCRVSMWSCRNGQLSTTAAWLRTESLRQSYDAVICDAKFLFPILTTPLWPGAYSGIGAMLFQSGLRDRLTPIQDLVVELPLAPNHEATQLVIV